MTLGYMDNRPLTYAVEQREQRKAEFLDVVRRTHRVKDAIAQTGTPETTLKYWRLHDPAFKAALAQARQIDTDVLRGFARGGGDTSVAAELQVNRSTVTRRVVKLMEKLGIASRAQLAAIAHEVTL